MGHTNNKETFHLRPLSDFTRIAVERMNETHSLVGLAALTGDSPTYLKQCLDGRSNFNVGKIIKLMNKGLIDETLLSQFKVTKTDNWNFDGIRASSVSLALYVYRMMLAGEVRDGHFPKLIAYLESRKGEKMGDELADTEDTKIPTNDVMLLVAFKGHNDQGIRYISAEALRTLQGLNPDVQFEVMENEHDVFVNIFRELDKVCFKKELPVTVDGTLTVRNAKVPATPAPKEAQQKLFDNTTA